MGWVCNSHEQGSKFIQNTGGKSLENLSLETHKEAGRVTLILIIRNV